jgi:hypothetical protein
MSKIFSHYCVIIHKMFDILRDSAHDIAKGLLDEAWGGNFPAGGLDFPSGCVLSKSTDQNSDLHIELGLVDEVDSVSEVPWLADLTHGDVQGPHDSDSPFKFLNGEGDLPGMFGTALKAYGQVVAILAEYGVDYTAYDNWFRAQWGIARETDLSLSIPALRSHGSALWGGLARKLSPATFCNIATSKQVRVKWHGKGRKDYGADKLIDWPRLTAIAQTVGSYLLVEDKYAKIKRIDFKLVKRELPAAPIRPGDTLANFPCPDDWEVRDLSNTALQFLAGFRAASLHLARNALGTTGTLTVGRSVNIPSNAIAAFIREHHVPPAPIDIGLPNESGIFDFFDEDPTKPVVAKTAPNITIYTGFASVIKPYVNKHWREMPTSFAIRAMHDTLFMEGGTERVDAEEAAKKLMDKLVPDDFLLRFFRIVNLAKKSRSDAEEMVGSLLKALKAPRSVFGHHDFINVGVSIRNNKACWGWMLEEIRKQVSANVYDKGIHFKMTSALWRILSSNANGDIALAEIMRQRKAWWANEYIRRGKHNKERRVTYQIKARLFRATQIDVEEDGGARVNFAHAALVGALNASARAFLRKRRAFKFNVETVVEPGSLTLDQYAALLDRTYHPTHTWSEGVAEYRRSVAYLVDDVRDIMQFIASGMNDDLYMPKGGIDEDDLGESDIDDADVPVMIDYEDDIPDEEDVLEDGDDGGFDFDDDEEEVDEDKNAGLVDLHGELEDECSYIPLMIRTQAIGKYGRYVSFDQAAEVVKELHTAYMATLGKDSGELVGEDLEDI